MNSTIVAQFIDDDQKLELEDKKAEFESVLKIIRRFKEMTEEAKILEIGIGTGLFQIHCRKAGFSCAGLEIKPELVEYARQSASREGVNLDLEIGNIEVTDIGMSKYDIVIANSVFEHVKDWRGGLQRIFNSLKPGGLLYFYSTNKFSFRSGEYDFPLYGWLPDSWRYRLRKALQGEGIMEWGIDFNQFTYFGLRRFFRHLGFSKILDHVDFLDPYNLNHPTVLKKVVLKTLKRFKPFKHVFLFFSGGTFFICVK